MASQQSADASNARVIESLTIAPSLGYGVDLMLPTTPSTPPPGYEEASAIHKQNSSHEAKPYLSFSQLAASGSAPSSPASSLLVSSSPPTVEMTNQRQYVQSDQTASSLFSLDTPPPPSSAAPSELHSIASSTNYSSSPLTTGSSATISLGQPSPPATNPSRTLDYDALYRSSSPALQQSRTVSSTPALAEAGSVDEVADTLRAKLNLESQHQLVQNSSNSTTQIYSLTSQSVTDQPSASASPLHRDYYAMTAEAQSIIGKQQQQQQQAKDDEKLNPSERKLFQEAVELMRDMVKTMSEMKDKIIKLEARVEQLERERTSQKHQEPKTTDIRAKSQQDLHDLTKPPPPSSLPNTVVQSKPLSSTNQTYTARQPPAQNIHQVTYPYPVVHATTNATPPTYSQAIQQVAHGRVLSHGVANTTQPVQVLYTTAVPSTTPQVMYAIPNYYVQQQQSQPPHRG